MSEQLFYVQDSRAYVGNDVLWWALKGNGYTTDLSKAQTYSQSEAQQMHTSRPSDIPWPKPYIDGKTRPAVDMQFIKRDEALAGSGIELVAPKKSIKDQFRCNGCGRLMTAENYYCAPCDNCGTENRP